MDLLSNGHSLVDASHAFNRMFLSEREARSDTPIFQALREALKQITDEHLSSQIPRRELRLLKAVLVDGIERDHLPSHLNLAPITAGHLIGLATTALGKALGDRESAERLMNHHLMPNFRLSDDEEGMLREDPRSFVKSVLSGERAVPPFISEKNLKIVSHYFLDGLVVKASGEREGIGLPTAENRRRYGVSQLSEWLSAYGVERQEMARCLAEIRDARLKEMEVPPVSSDEALEIKTQAGLESFLRVSIKLGGGTLYPKNRFSLPLFYYFIQGKSFEEISKLIGQERQSVNSVTREGVGHLVSVLSNYGIDEKSVREAVASLRRKAARKEAREFVRGIKEASVSLDETRLPKPITVWIGKYSRRGSDEYIFKSLGIKRPSNVETFSIHPSIVNGVLHLTLSGPGGYRREIEWEGRAKGKSTIVDGSGSYRREKRIDYPQELRRIMARDILGPSSEFDFKEIQEKFRRSPVKGAIWLRANLVPICWLPITNLENFRWKLYRTAVDEGIYRELIETVKIGLEETYTGERLRAELDSSKPATKVKSLLNFMEISPEEFYKRLLKLQEEKDPPRHLNLFITKTSQILEFSRSSLWGMSWYTGCKIALDSDKVRKLLTEIDNTSRDDLWKNHLVIVAQVAPCEFAFTFTRLKRELRVSKDRPAVLRGYEKLDRYLTGEISRRARKLKEEYSKNGLVRGRPVNFS